MRKIKTHFLSVVIPAYCQEKTIVADLNQIKSVLDRIRYNYEIIVVVDGKADQTFAQAKSLRSRKIKVIGYETNRGKGYAIRFGMVRTKGDLIAFIDAGMDINPNGLSMVLEHMEWYQADIIVGSKRHPVSKVPDYPFIRKVYSFGYHLLVWLLFGIKLRDTQVGLKVFKRPVLEKVLPRLLIKKHAIDIEILSVARRLGFRRIYEAPVEINTQKQIFTSTISWHTVKDMALDTLAVFYRLKILRYYDDTSNRRWLYDPELEFRINVT